ncbi:MAG: sigma-70 family RNA polymerase sigma factor [Pirellulales bacterium]
MVARQILPVTFPIRFLGLEVGVYLKVTALPDDTDGLIDRVAAGDRSAVTLLLKRHRSRLCRMVQVHFDRRLMSRVDPSDIVQEAITEASRRLDQYARERPIPFYPWLRSIAWDRLVNLQVHHVQTQKRSILREQGPELPDESVCKLASRLADPGQSPSRSALRAEVRDRVRSALGRLPTSYREVLVIRHLEELDVQSTAAVLNISEAAVKTRHLRALRRMHELLSAAGGASDG